MEIRNPQSAVKVLYAEDNPLDADQTRTHFAEAAPEFHIEIAGTGQACLDRLRETGFDLLLLDHRLPDMDGLDVLKALVRDGTPVPVVLVTGVGDEELVVKALRLGAANYVPKQGNYLESLPDLLRGVVEEQHRKQRQGLSATASPRRILYVEHLPMDIELTLRHFAEAAPHFAAEVVHSCAAALARLEQPPAYDLALIDLRMPDLSGLDFVREAKRRRLVLPPFIMISGKSDDAAAIATLKLGAADYIAKREGYLNQLTYCIDHAIEHDRLNRLNEQLRLELIERNRVEEKLAASEAHFRTLIEHASDLISVLNQGGVIRFQGPSSERLLGYAPEDMVGHPAAEWLHPADAPLVGATLQRALTHPNQPVAVEYRFRHRNGTWRTLESIGRSLPNQAAEGFIVVNSRDVTEQRQLGTQLRRSQKMEAIGQLAGGVAHDLNNALAPIIMSAGLLRLEFPDTAASYVDLIQAGAKRGADMVKQLLTFAKGAEGERLLLQPRHLLTEMDKLIRGTFPKNITLETRYPNDLWTILGDATQLHQVFLNLCVNARDAMPNGGTLTLQAENVEVDAVHASATPEAQPGRYVRWQVVDTGAGILPDILDRIFDPFFTTKGPDQGTGLGLSTVIGIVKSHGGFIQVYSVPGRGSTFGVHLPADHAGSDTEPATTTAVDFRGQGETILFVDDELAVREMARAVLRRLNFKPLTATDGADGLMQAAQHGTELRAIITDLHMPHMDGLTFVRALRRTLPDLPVVVASGRMEDAMAEEFKTLDVTSRLDKPFSEGQLAEALKNLLAPK